MSVLICAWLYINVKVDCITKFEVPHAPVTYETRSYADRRQTADKLPTCATQNQSSVLHSDDSQSLLNTITMKTTGLILCSHEDK